MSYLLFYTHSSYCFRKKLMYLILEKFWVCSKIYYLCYALQLIRFTYGLHLTMSTFQFLVVLYLKQRNLCQLKNLVSTEKSSEQLFCLVDGTVFVFCSFLSYSEQQTNLYKENKVICYIMGILFGVHIKCNLIIICNVKDTKVLKTRQLCVVLFVCCNISGYVNNFNKF